MSLRPKELFKDLEEGISEDRKYTLAHAVRDFLAYGLPRCSTGTVDNTHIIPGLGARKLRELTADDVDRRLADRAKVLSTRPLREVLSLLRRRGHCLREGADRSPSQDAGVIFENLASRPPVVWTSDV